MAGGTQRVAARQTSGGEPASANQAVPSHGLGGVIRARGQKPTGTPEIGRKQHFVAANSQRARQAPRETSSRLADAAFEGAAVIGFKSSQGGVKQLAFQYDDHIKTWRDLIVTENLSYQPFSTIPLDRPTELFRGGYSQPSDIEPIGQDEERAVTTVHAGTLFIGLLKI